MKTKILIESRISILWSRNEVVTIHYSELIVFVSGQFFASIVNPFAGKSRFDVMAIQSINFFAFFCWLGNVYFRNNAIQSSITYKKLRISTPPRQLIWKPLIRFVLNTSVFCLSFKNRVHLTSRIIHGHVSMKFP